MFCYVSLFLLFWSLISSILRSPVGLIVLSPSALSRLFRFTSSRVNPAQFRLSRLFSFDFYVRFGS